jgi:hypothetical protein
MSDVNKLSERVIEYAERASAVADAAQGKRRIRSSRPGRWLLLPAAGAGVYALLRSKKVTRQAKGAMNEAKTRASELPDELMNRVGQATKTKPSGAAASRNGASQRRRTSSARTKTASSGRAKTASSGRTKAASR